MGRINIRVSDKAHHELKKKALDKHMLLKDFVRHVLEKEASRK